MDKQHFRPIDAAQYLGISLSFLNKMRITGNGPAFIKHGRKVVIYTKNALDSWLAERTHNSTSEY